MILERVRPRVKLMIEKMASCAQAVEEQKTLATEELQTIRMYESPISSRTPASELNREEKEPTKHTKQEGQWPACDETTKIRLRLHK